MLLILQTHVCRFIHYLEENKTASGVAARSSISFSFDFALGVSDTIKVRFQGVSNIAIADVTILIENLTK